MAINISYQDTTLASFTSGSRVLKTAGKYLVDDITIEALLESGYSLISVIPEQTVTTSLNTLTNEGISRNLAYLTKIEGERFSPNDYYLITINNTQWISNCKELWSSGEYVVGTPQWFLGTSINGEYIYPFAVDDNSVTTELAAPAGQYTLQVDRLVFTNSGGDSGGASSSSVIIPKTITANGIYDPSDDDADGYGVVTVNVADSRVWDLVYDGTATADVENKEFKITELGDLYFAEGETWRVTWDGVEYECITAIYDNWLWTIGNFDIANPNSTDEPFWIYNLGFDNPPALTGDANESGTHTLKLEKLVGDTDNPLFGKIAVFTGDSICAGQGYAGGYAKIIGEENHMTIQNLGVGDGCIAPYTDNEYSRFVISTSIADMRSDADYVILEGGVNDAGYEISLGTLSNGYTATLDTNTFAGAFEYMLKSAIAKFPTAKIGYIFVHKCEPNFDSSTTGSYYNIAKAACEKWGIPYCDLNTCTPPLGYINELRTTYTLNGDSFHPTEAGYRLFYVPQITAFMKTFLSDHTMMAKTITTNGTYNATDDEVNGYSSVTVNVSGGGGTSPATQHTLYLEFSDNTNTTIPIYCNDSIITALITDSPPPVSYNGKIINSAAFDGTTWYMGGTWQTLAEGSTNLNPNGNDQPGSYAWISELSDVYPLEGSIWRITLFGTTYIETAHSATVEGGTTVVIGNPKWSGGPDNGSTMPVDFLNFGWGAWVGDTQLPSGSMPFKIEQLITS